MLQLEGILETWMIEYCAFQKFLYSTLCLWPDDTPFSWTDRTSHLLVSFSAMKPWPDPLLWSCQDKSDAVSEENLDTEFHLKVSIILGIPENVFSPLGLGRSFPSRGRRNVAQGLSCLCCWVEVMDSDNFSLECFCFCSSACWCDNINQHFCGNSAFGDEHCNQDEEILMSIDKIKESKFSRIAFTGKTHFHPKPPLSTSSMLARQSQAWPESEGVLGKPQQSCSSYVPFSQW